MTTYRERVEGLEATGYPDGGVRGVYLRGWRNAIGAAAEIAAEADARVAGLEAEVAELREAKDRFDTARGAALDRAERAEAENATLRGAMPDAQMLDSYATGIEWEGCDAGGLRQAAAAIRAQYNPATPTPPAAEAVTGGESSAWVWELEGLLRYGDCEGVVLRTWVWSELTSRHGQLGYDVELIETGQERSAGTLAGAVHALAEALAALDTSQEADHAQ